ncbi:MAG: Ldh family oxidoreductase [Dehalococcoidia bacterium]|nr:Ldh family oxidoreductase [Dehalococcoidia bacterium]MCA9852841.1 Ldh family oxidoreductase [Dehalococcoidia bacterium]
MPETRPRYAASDLREFTAATFRHFGLGTDDAAVAAEVLVDADLQGIESHGIAHLPWHFGYVPGLKQGVVNPRPQVKVERESPVAATWDADGGLGVLVGKRAMEAAMAKAADVGIGMVAVRNGRHFGAAGYYAHMAAREDMIGMAMCNVPAIANAAGGLDRVYGTNPIAFGAPIEDEQPFLLDIATTAVAGGKLEIATRQGKPIPEGWAVDSEGKHTPDPTALRQGGALLPLGSSMTTSSYKGYGLGLMVDILTGVLPGAGSALFNERFHQGFWFAAWRIDAFTDPAAFKANMKRMAEHIRATRPESGRESVMIAGDPEWRARRDREANGVPLDEETIQQLTELGAEIGRPFPGAM